MAAKIGDLVRVENTAGKFGAADAYCYVLVRFPDGAKRSLLLTDHEVQRAAARAAKNPEDVPAQGWLRRLFG